MPADLRRSVSVFALSLLVAAPFSANAQTADDLKGAPKERGQATLTEADREALAKLQGIWRPIEIDGESAKSHYLPTFTIEGQRLGWPGNEGDPILIDTSVSPARLDFVSGEAGRLGYLANIFKFEGDSLILCRKSARRVPRDVSKVQGPGPTKFDSSEGQLVVFERAEPLPAPVAVIGFECDYSGRIFVDFDGADRAAISIGPCVLLWDLKEGKPIARYAEVEPQRTWPSRAIFLPDGERLAINSQLHGEDQTSIWNPRTDAVEARVKGLAAVAAPDGESFLTWDDEGTLRRFDVKSFELEYESGTPGSAPQGVLFLPDSKRCVVYPDSGWATVHDMTGADDHSFDMRFLGESSMFLDAALDSTGERLMVLEQAQRDFRIVVRTAPDFDVANEFEVDQTPQAFAAAPDGRSLYVGTYAGTIDQVDAEDGALLRSYRPLDRLDVPLGRVESVRLSPDGSYLAGIRGNICYLWNLKEAPEGEPRKVVRWPARTAEETRKESERSDRLWHFPLALAFVELEPGKIAEAPKNLVDEQGKPTLSWRVRMLGEAGGGLVERALRKNEPWDSEWNRRAIPLGAEVFRWSGVEAGKTTWQLATGPTTALEKLDDPRAVESPAWKILLVETALDRAVVWSEPRDFVFDPENPRAGLPQDGFHYASWDGRTGFVRADIPDDLLRRMFAVKGEISDEEALPYIESPFDRLFR